MTDARKEALEWINMRLMDDNSPRFKAIAETIKNALEGPKWEPIETAPKDGE